MTHRRTGSEPLLGGTHVAGASPSPMLCPHWARPAVLPRFVGKEPEM